MHARLLGYVLVGLLAPSVATAVGESPTSGEPSAPGHGKPEDGMNMELSDAQIVGALKAANDGEIAAGEQAQRKAESQADRDFADRMVTEHSSANEKLDSLAARLGITSATSPVSEHLAKMADHIVTMTEPYTGASYDVLYVDGQLYMHSLVVGLVDWFSVEADAPELRAAILELRPAILDHLDTAEELRQQLGDPPAVFEKQ